MVYDQNHENSQERGAEEKVEEKIEINIDKIKYKRKYFPRKRVDRSTVELYMEDMKAGAIFPPIVITKDDYIIIDGVHRYLAHKELNHQKIEAILRNIPLDKIYTEAIKLNRNHGINFTKEEMDEHILTLYQDYNYTFKEIGEVIGRHESTVSKRFKEIAQLRNLGSKEIKDKRKKVDIEEVKKRLAEGKESQSDIAKNFNISEAYVSQIAKAMREEDESPFHMMMDGYRMRDFVTHISVNGMLDDVIVRFHPEGVFSSKFDHDKGFGVFGFLSPSAFHSYQCEDKFEFLLSIEWVNRVKYFSKKSDNIILQIIGEDLKMTTEKDSYSSPIDRVESRIVPAFSLVDGNGGLIKSPGVAYVQNHMFKGLIGNTENVCLSFSNDSLEISGVTKYEFYWHKPIEIEYEGEESSLEVDGDYLTQIMKSSFKLQGDLRLFLSEDKQFLLVNYNTIDGWINYIFQDKTD